MSTLETAWARESGGKAPPAPTKRPVFVSLSVLLHELRRVPGSVLEDSLFFFGSKRMWLFPSTVEERLESEQQPTDYIGLPPAFRELLLRKEARGEVCFLKPDILGAPDAVVVGDYSKASAWLVGLTDPSTGVPYRPLRLDPAWWEESFTGGQFLPRPLWKAVVSNFTKGRHGYAEVCELVAQSNASLQPVLSYSSGR